MNRHIYRAQLRKGSEEEGLLHLTRQAFHAQRRIDGGDAMTFAAYQWGNQLFVYYETIDRDLRPEDILEGMDPFLEYWPGRSEYRRWVQMAVVFHFNGPAGKEHWLRKQPVERRVGRVAHLLPDKINSYIYYHYQLQEERAFLGDKYEIIAIHENLLFGYQEFPKVVEQPVIPGKLRTEGTPKDWNEARMDLHFQPWEDGHLYFKPITQLFALYGESAE